MKLPVWPDFEELGAVDPVELQRVLESLRELLVSLTLNDNTMSAVVELRASDGLISGAELQRGNPKKFRPIGFLPISVVDSNGSGLGIASWAFNPKATNGSNWHGITITVTSGTIEKATGILVGG